MKIGADCVVTLRQQVADADGRVIDTGAEPIRYLHGGHDDIFPRIEAALDGKATGDAIRVTLSPAEAFGAIDPALIRLMPPDAFARPPQVGDQLEEQGDDTNLFRVVELRDGMAVVDGNHPLAGLTLVFSATVLDIRPATAEEIAAKRRPSAVAAAPIVAVAPVGRTAAHKLFWHAPMFILPAVAATAEWRGARDLAIAIGVGWLLWTLAVGKLVDWAIEFWGERFLFFDFSANPQPSVLERRIITLGAVVPLVLACGAMVYALTLKGFGEFWEILAAGVLAFVVLVIPCAIVVPFVVMLATGFRVRPVIDD